MAIRTRFKEKQRRVRPELVSWNDPSGWTDAELAAWLEGRAYELLGSPPRDPAKLEWSRRTEYTVLVSAAKRLTREPK